MAARLHHPHVVLAYAAFPAGEALVLAMEHIDGLSLAELVAREGPLPVARACDYARQAALGLQAAHEAGMVHRDIKPQNLMVTRRGEVKVLDFGLAKVVSEEGESGLTGTGMLMGTPDYMAPEQSLDAKAADIRADVYSLGCALFFLLTGKPPFAGVSAFAVVQAHHSQPVPRLAGVPAGLGELVADMMAKRPDDRPQTPGEVVRRLLPYCEVVERTVVTTTPLPPPPRRPPRAESTTPLPPARRRGGAFGLRVAGAAVGLASVVLAGVWLAGAIGPASRTPHAEAPDDGVPKAPPEAAQPPVGLKADTRLSGGRLAPSPGKRAAIWARLEAKSGSEWRPLAGKKLRISIPTKDGPPAFVGEIETDGEGRATYPRPDLRDLPKEPYLLIEFAGDDNLSKCHAEVRIK